MYIMTASIQDIPKTNRNELSFCLLDSTNIADFNSNDFVILERVMKHGDGLYVGAYKNGIPVAFGGLIVRDKKISKQTDYFLLKRSDLYLVYLWVSKEYRGKGIMGDLISYLTNIQGIRNGDISLCVAINNSSAIRCYQKNGFQIVKKFTFVHFFWPYDFPKYSV